jgi:hypothetical protein
MVKQIGEVIGAHKIIDRAIPGFPTHAPIDRRVERYIHSGPNRRRLIHGGVLV